MIVSSPIGDLPLKIEKLRITSSGIELRGAMGAWPARVLIKPRDLLDLIRVSALALTVAVISLAVVVYFIRLL